MRRNKQVKDLVSSSNVLKLKLNEHLFMKGPKQRYMSIHGGLKLAAHRTIFRSGSHAITLALGVNVSDRTVVAYEVKLRQARLQSFRDWHMRRVLRMYERSDSDVGLMCLVQRFRCDATNTNIWRSKKLHVMEMRSSFTNTLYPTTQIGDSFKVEDVAGTRQTLASLQVVKDSSARGILGILDKQFDSIVGSVDKCTNILTKALTAGGLPCDLPKPLKQIEDEVVFSRLGRGVLVLIACLQRNGLWLNTDGLTS